MVATYKYKVSIFRIEGRHPFEPFYWCTPLLLGISLISWRLPWEYFDEQQWLFMNAELIMGSLGLFWCSTYFTNKVSWLYWLNDCCCWRDKDGYSTRCDNRLNYSNERKKNKNKKPSSVFWLTNVYETFSCHQGSQSFRITLQIF